MRILLFVLFRVVAIAWGDAAMWGVVVTGATAVGGGIIWLFVKRRSDVAAARVAEAEAAKKEGDLVVDQAVHKASGIASIMAGLTDLADDLVVTKLRLTEVETEASAAKSSAAQWERGQKECEAREARQREEMAAQGSKIADLELVVQDLKEEIAFVHQRQEARLLELRRTEIIANEVTPLPPFEKNT